MPRPRRCFISGRLRTRFDDISYRFIDSLLGPAGADAVDWDLIETHFRDLMRVAIPIREGRISSATLMRQLSSNSRRDHIYQTFREVGKHPHDPAAQGHLRRAAAPPGDRGDHQGRVLQRPRPWLQFGKRGVLADNDPDQQEKLMKFNQLLANCVIFHNTLDVMDAVRAPQAGGWQIEAEDPAQIAPYLTEHINRFGEYSTDELSLVPEQFDPHLEIDFEMLHEPVAG